MRGLRMNFPTDRTPTTEDFDLMYGAGMRHRVSNIINDLAPVTRRDDWWATEGPFEIIAMHLMKRDEANV